MKHWIVPYSETVKHRGELSVSAPTQAGAIEQFRNTHPQATLTASPYLNQPAKKLPRVTVSTDERLTVCITSFRRAKYLHRAIYSAVSAGADFVVVASMTPDEDTLRVLELWKVTLREKLTVAVIGADLGCNELWLQAVYRSRTERVIVLHDDDFLEQKLGGVYRNVICPAMRDGAGFSSWRGVSKWDDGRSSSYDYFKQKTSVLDSSVLEKLLLRTATPSLSPIISVLRRSVLIEALKEAGRYFTDQKCWLHPGMLLGTEILVYLRHCEAFSKWLCVDEDLSCYGCHNGSGTIAAQQAGTMRTLTDGYDLARKYFQKTRNADISYEPRLLLVYSEYEPASDDERRRFAFARESWDFHFNHGTMLDFPIWNHELPRTSAIFGDERPVPFIKDIINHAMCFACPEDIVVFANKDVIFTTMATDRIIAGIAKGNGAMAGIRRNFASQPSRLLRSALRCRPDTGFDVFAMTPNWWAEHASEMPDMLIGREAWDSVLRTIMDRHCGGNSRVDDVFYHELHHSFWTKERVSNAGQIHNRKLALEFFTRAGDEWMMKMLSVNNPEKLFALEEAKRATL